MFKFERTHRRKMSPDMTPLVDIVFQLLLFFMLTTAFIKVEAISVMVTGGKSKAEPHAASEKPAIIMQLDGEDVYIDNIKIQKNQLDNMLANDFSADKSREIKLVTQKGVSVQAMVTALDAVKKNGGQNISINIASIQRQNTNMPPELFEQNQVVPPQVPMPDLQSTKNMPDLGNAGNFDFDALGKGFTPKNPK